MSSLKYLLPFQVEHEPLPAVMSIDDAIESKQFHPQYERTLEKGDVDAAFASAEVAAIVEGDVRMGGQEHFYLEPHCNFVQPIESDEYLLVSSTQASPQLYVAGHMSTRTGAICH